MRVMAWGKAKVWGWVMVWRASELAVAPTSLHEGGDVGILVLVGVDVACRS